LSGRVKPLEMTKELLIVSNTIIFYKIHSWYLALLVTERKKPSFLNIVRAFCFFNVFFILYISVRIAYYTTIVGNHGTFSHNTKSSQRSMHSARDSDNDCILFGVEQYTLH